MTAAHYIIHRVNFELEAPEPAAARRLQDVAAHLFHHRILPRLEELLEKLVPRETFFRLDALNLDLDRLDEASFEEEFTKVLLQEMEAKIQLIVDAASHPETDAEEQTAVTLTGEERRFAAFLHFLATGSLPWWCEHHPGALDEEILEQQVLSLGVQARMRLLRLLAASDVALCRLILQFSPAFLRRLIAWLPAGSGDTVTRENLLQAMAPPARLGQVEPPATDAGSERLQERLRQLVRRWAGADTLPSRQDEKIQAEPEQAPDGRQEPAYRRQLRPSTTSAVRRPGQQPESLQQQEHERESGIFVDHAGLVLLHPFLTSFFQEFSLLEDKEFVDAPARTLAVHLLQYLATGRENPPEYQLGFEKYLCGCDRVVPLPRFVGLSAPMQAEADKLLRAAIGHWRALKNTSPAGLREGFLQRPGKLVPGDFQDRLIVEARSHDILLGYLPWGYAMVKMPWMRQPLIVDWTN